MTEDVKDTAESNYKDLFEFSLEDETHIQAWTDEESTFLTIAFVTLCIPNEVFEELLEKLTQYFREKNNNTGVI